MKICRSPLVLCIYISNNSYYYYFVYLASIYHVPYALEVPRMEE